MTSLTVLDIVGCNISDITPLAAMTNLEMSNLANNQINDITPLSSLTNLQFLSLGDNPLTQTQIDALQKALPKCTITH